MIKVIRALPAVLAAALAAVWSTAAADGWPPMTPEELRMTAEPKAPRAPAI